MRHALLWLSACTFGSSEPGFGGGSVDQPMAQCLSAEPLRLTLSADLPQGEVALADTCGLVYDVAVVLDDPNQAFDLVGDETLSIDAEPRAVEVALVSAGTAEGQLLVLDAEGARILGVQLSAE